ncbi:hypothetical protein E2C01_065599 [Portunus trituberculatus]|uniref:Uncharacterized protein n=1 Tax=Portunus trituberculatus TaxID=210409 RepID=A0A5B7HS75_PORTR|nr:hypothetical protein [Portunus trituberculatus]
MTPCIRLTTQGQAQNEPLEEYAAWQLEANSCSLVLVLLLVLVLVLLVFQLPLLAFLWYRVYIHLRGGSEGGCSLLGLGRGSSILMSNGPAMSRNVSKRSCDDDGTSYPRMPFLCPIVFGG